MSIRRSGRRGEPRGRAARRIVRLAAVAALVFASGCYPYADTVYDRPRPTAPQPLPKAPPVPPPPMQRTPTAPYEEPLARLPHDEEGLGRGPLGRANVLLDRAIVVTEQSQQRGEPVDAGLLAHLRMTRQARDLIATGDTERAADLLERAIAIDDGAGFGYLYLGYIHLIGGRTDQADVFLDRAVGLLPPDPALRMEVDKLRASAEAVSSLRRAPTARVSRMTAAPRAFAGA
jgi:hypothetical protein